LAQYSFLPCINKYDIATRCIHSIANCHSIMANANGPASRAPPVGWRPTVKTTVSASSGLGGVSVNGAVTVPGAGQGYRGAAPSGRQTWTSATLTAGAGGAGGVGPDENLLADLFGGSGGVTSYGAWAASGCPTLQGSRSSAKGKLEQEEKEQEKETERGGPSFEDRHRHQRRDSDEGEGEGQGKAESRKLNISALFEDSDEEDRKLPSQELPGGRAGKEEAQPADFQTDDLSDLFDRLSTKPPPQSTKCVAPQSRSGGPDNSRNACQEFATSKKPPGSALARPGATSDPPQQPQAVRRHGKLILDLDSHIVDVAVDWGRRGLLEAIVLLGRTSGAVRDWADMVLAGGRELRECHFEDMGIELSLADAACLSRFSEVDRLVAALKKDVAITSLSLARCCLDNSSANMLAGGLIRNRTLRHLSLSENDIGDEGVEAISAALEQHPALQSLDLSSNHFGENGVRFIAEGLARNRSLRSLDLSANSSIGDIGAKCLAAALDPQARSAASAKLQQLGLEECCINQTGRSALQKAAANRRSAGAPELLISFEPSSAAHQPWSKERGEGFVVVCSPGGVEITTTETGLGRLSWGQTDIALSIQLRIPWLRRWHRGTVFVEFGARKLHIEARCRPLLDLDLFAAISAEESSFSIREGLLEVTLVKWERCAWKSLAPVEVQVTSASGARGI